MLNRRALFSALAGAPLGIAAFVKIKANGPRSGIHPATIQKGETVLSAKQRISAQGLSAEQLDAILDKNNKACAKNIGPALREWQAKDAESCDIAGTA